MVISVKRISFGGGGEIQESYIKFFTSTRVTNRCQQQPWRKFNEKLSPVETGDQIASVQLQGAARTRIQPNSMQKFDPVSSWYLGFICFYYPFSRDLPNPGTKLRSPTLQADALPAEPPGKPKNTGVGSLPLLQGIFLTQESNWGHLHCRWILYQLSYQEVSIL